MKSNSFENEIIVYHGLFERLKESKFEIEIYMIQKKFT